MRLHHACHKEDRPCSCSKNNLKTSSSTLILPHRPPASQWGLLHEVEVSDEGWTTSVADPATSAVAVLLSPVHQTAEGMLVLCGRDLDTHRPTSSALAVVWTLHPSMSRQQSASPPRDCLGNSKGQPPLPHNHTRRLCCTTWCPTVLPAPTNKQQFLQVWQLGLHTRSRPPHNAALRCITQASGHLPSPTAHQFHEFTPILHQVVAHIEYLQWHPTHTLSH